MGNNTNLMTLEEYIIAVKGSKPSVLKAKKFPESVPYLDINALENNQVSQYTFREDTDLASEKDVLVVWDGSRSGLPFKGKEGAIGSTLMCLKSNTIDQDYLFHFLKYNFDFINGNLTGIGIPHVDSNIFFSLEILHQTIEQQKIIVKDIQDKYQQNNVLRNQQSSIARQLLDNTLIEFPYNAESMEDSISNFRKAVLQNAIIGKLTLEWRKLNNEEKVSITNKNPLKEEFRALDEIPLTWQWASLGDVAICERGRFSARPRNDPYYYGGEYPFIQIGDIPEDGGKITSHKQTLNEEGIKVSKMFSQGTIVLAIVGSTIGNTGVLGYTTYFPDSIVGINGNKYVLNDYLSLYLRKEKENLRRLSYSSGGQPNLKLDYIKSYPMPVPPISEQYEIIKNVEILFKVGEQVLSSYERDTKLLYQLEQSILEKAFKGSDKDNFQKVNVETLRLSKLELEQEIKLSRIEQRKFKEKTFMKAKNKSELKEYIKIIALEKFVNDGKTSMHSQDILNLIVSTIPNLDLDDFSEAFLELTQDKIQNEDEPFFISINEDGLLKFKINSIYETTISKAL